MSGSLSAGQVKVGIGMRLSVLNLAAKSDWRFPRDGRPYFSADCDLSVGESVRRGTLTLSHSAESAEVDDFGLIQLFPSSSSSDFVGVNVTAEQWKLLMDAKLSPRQFLLRMAIVGRTDKKLLPDDIVHQYAVKIYSVELEEFEI